MADRCAEFPGTARVTIRVLWGQGLPWFFLGLTKDNRDICVITVTDAVVEGAVANTEGIGPGAVASSPEACGAQADICTVLPPIIIQMLP
jgi:hypothetical protein